MGIKRIKLPEFKYHLDPFKSGIIVKYSGVCQCCYKHSSWQYMGPFYGRFNLEYLCPWCIENGLANERLDIKFVDGNRLEYVSDEEKTKVLMSRTPGYYSAMFDPWPAHCDDYCVFVGKTNWNELKALTHELESDIQAVMIENHLTYGQLIYELSREASPLWAHLFRCLHCGKHRFVADYE